MSRVCRVMGLARLAWGLQPNPRWFVVRALAEMCVPDLRMRWRFSSIGEALRWQALKS